MKIALVAFYFPPDNQIAAVRLGKLACHMVNHGYDLRVLTPPPTSRDQSLAIEIDTDHIEFTGYTDQDARINPIRVFNRWISNSSRIAENSPEIPNSARTGLSLRQWIGGLYRNLALFPDHRVGWQPHLARTLERLCREWEPDLILVSGPPFSSFPVVARQAARYGIPWVAEFRDRWMDDPYTDWPRWRRRFDHWFERRILADAVAIVTVTDLWSDFYAAKYRKPITCVMNGFDPADFDHRRHIPASDTPLRIVHMGSVYANRRDPTALFHALKVGGFNPDDITVEFFGREFDYLAERITTCDVQDLVHMRDSVSYNQSLQIQRDTDILLLIQWNDPADNSNIPGKLFEYLASRRPILGLGPLAGFPAQTIRGLDAGLYSNEPSEIAAWLQAKLDEKRRCGTVVDLPAEEISLYTRDRQFDHLRQFLSKAVNFARRREAVVRHVPKLRPISTREFARPVLTMIIDTESEFDWSGAFARSNDAVSAIPELEQLYKLTRPRGIRPIQLIDYPVASSAMACNFLGQAHANGDCDIGMQLHSWTTPPFDELVCEFNTFACNLDRELHARKLDCLLEAIERGLGIRPEVFKAGRYGIDAVGIDLLRQRGIKVDTSYLPQTNLAPQGGPDFTNFTYAPGWLDANCEFLELPITRDVVSWTSTRIRRALYRNAAHPFGRAMRMPGIMSRVGIADCLTLSPEGMTLDELKRLTKSLIGRGQRLLTLSFHSPSLAPGHTPYVRTDAEREAFLKRIDAYLDFFVHELDGEFMTPTEIYANMDRACERNGVLS